MQERRRLERDGGTEKTCPADEKRTQTGHDPVGGAQVRGSLMAAVQDQKLVSDQHGLSDHATNSAGLCQPNDGDDQMEQKDQEVAHLGNRTKTCQAFFFRGSLEFAMDRHLAEFGIKAGAQIIELDSSDAALA